MMRHFQEVLRVAQDYRLELLVSFILFSLVVNKYGRGLNPFPRPFLAGFTDLWRFLMRLIAILMRLILSYTGRQIDPYPNWPEYSVGV